MTLESQAIICDGSLDRMALCCQGLELFVPAHPAPLVPTAVHLPCIEEEQVVIDVRLQSIERGSHVFYLESSDDSVRFFKCIRLTIASARTLVSSLKDISEVATTPLPHPIVGAFLRKRNVSHQLYCLLVKIMAIPRALEDSRLHQCLGLNESEAKCLCVIARHMRAWNAKAQHVRKQVAYQIKQVVQEIYRYDWECALLVAQAIRSRTRYSCNQPLRLPLLTYDHDMTFRFTKPKDNEFGHILGPGSIIYFLLETIKPSLHDCCHGYNIFDLEKKPLASIQTITPSTIVIKRVLPKCRLHTAHSQRNDLVDAMYASLSNQTIRYSTTSAPGIFRNLQELQASPKRGRSYEISAVNSEGFIFYLGNWKRLSSPNGTCQATSALLTVYPGHDAIMLLAMALALDIFHENWSTI